MYRTRILLTVLMLVFTAGICKAESSSSNEQRIARLEAALAAMQAELVELKTEQVKAAEIPIDRKKLDAMVKKVLEEKKADMKLVPDWVNNFKLKGDFRYRHEWTDDDSASENRNRHRIRARLGVYGKVNDEVDVGFGLASGTNEGATGTNQDLTDSFSSKEIWLDLAYFDYHPDAKGLHILGGKFKDPYYRVGNSDLMFDTDVRPEGAAATYKKALNSDLDFFSAIGGHYVQERETDADTSLWVIQAGLKYRIPDLEKTYIAGGGGYFDYGNTVGKDALGTSSTNYRGNKSTNGYDSDFDIAQAFGEVGFPVLGLPFKVFGEYLNNTNAASGEDTGFLVGASIGQCKKPGSWQVAYNYRELEADSIIGALAEATFAGGGTDIKGHKLSLGYQLAKNMQFGISYMMADRTRSGSTTDHDVILLDLNFKF